jgi:manganese/zinc/iron transport system permease protein
VIADLSNPTAKSAPFISADDLWRVISLADYNTRVVVLGTFMLGIAAGVVGSFMLLRKRALLGDALSHAMLPGVALAFIIATALGATGKSLPMLLLGAATTGVIGVGCILFLRHFTRLKEDAAMGIVLSVFFGAGVALLGVAQQMPTGHAAGLESFIYGKTASMSAADVKLILTAVLVVLAASVLFFKEFRLLCFDPEYSRAQGWPTLALDILMMALAVMVTVIGLQAVGLILIIALLIIPAAAARFWTERMGPMTAVAALIGGLSAYLGAGVSAVAPRLPSGAMIVLAAALIFAVSLVLGYARGVLWRIVDRVRLRRKIEQQHLLRAIYELQEQAPSPRFSDSEQGDTATPIRAAALLAERSWTAARLESLLRRGIRRGLLRQAGDRMYELTAKGLAEARRLTRNHRLWEMYLITHADIAPSHVDRDADEVEHVLGPVMAAKLEALLLASAKPQAVPGSPHPLRAAAGDGGFAS